VTTFAFAGRDDLLHVRFAISPLWETLAAVRGFGEEREAAHHRAWRRTVAARAEQQRGLRLLLAVQPRAGDVPDFLTPPPAGPSPRLRDQLAEVRATPPEQAAGELRRCLAGSSDPELVERLLEDPARAVRALADAIQAAWRELVAPFWPRIRALVDGDVDRRSRTLARRGLRGLFDELHPCIRWTDGGLAVRDREDATVTLDARGLLLMPSAFLSSAVAAIVDPPWQPAIVYPARGLAGLWHAPAAPPASLARLLGSTRALLLTTLERPLSTTTLAALTELSPAGVSRHLLALRDAGLLSTARHGHEVRYARTRLARALLEANRA
jgi:DNA-binding transcriptional ArsR family regulator